MQYGLRLPSFALGDQTATLDTMGAYLRHAEDLGFTTAMCIDHLLIVRPAVIRTWLEPMTLLAALAGVTRSIRLGPMALTLPLRNPVYFAKEWATFDYLSGGRSIFGVGVGWHEKEFEVMNVQRNQRGKRMDEMLEAIFALWEGDSVSYQGKHIQFMDVTVEPKPLRKPEVWIGGGTQPFEKIYGQATPPDMTPVLRRIAKYATTWVPHSSSTPEMVREDWARLEGYLAEMGRKTSDLTKAYSNFVYILKKGEKPESAVPKFSAVSGMNLDYWKTYYLLGEAEEVADKIRAKLEVMGGQVEHVVLNPINWGREQLELLANEVLPRVGSA